MRVRTLASLLMFHVTVAAAQDVVYQAADFAAWNLPAGLLTVEDDGLRVRRFGTTFNAVADADQHRSVVIGDYGTFVQRAASRPEQADLVTDQDHGTWWQPDADDHLQNWWLEIDLGRAVVANKIRIVFPDTVGAQPFNFFSVHTSPGVGVRGNAPRLSFKRVGRPISNNSRRVVELDLRQELRTNTTAPPSGQHLTLQDSLDFQVVRLVRFQAAGKNPDAALAEIEVDAVGFNVSTRVATEDRAGKGEPDWGGSTWTSVSRDCDGCGKGSGAQHLVDADVGRRQWSIQSSSGDRDWRDDGVWSVVDFGNVYRISRIVFVPIAGDLTPWLYGFATIALGGWPKFDMLTSDGTPSNVSDPTAEGPFDYRLLSEVRGSTPFADFQFPSRDIRLILWRVVDFEGRDANALQLFAFHDEGYPRRVDMESPDIDLGGVRSIRAVEWEGDLPPGTRVEVLTRTGNGFEELKRYYLANGDEVSKEAWDAARSRFRGPILTEQVRDATWSEWSQPHRISGQNFLSPTPRRWLRVSVRLLSEDPEAAPVLRSLRLVARAPLVAAGLSGSISPGEAPLDSLVEFSYTVRPLGLSARDSGFDQVVIGLPAGAGATVNWVAVGGREVAAASEVRGDSLVVHLPPPVVQRDSVSVGFTTRVFRNPTVFEASVVNLADPENSQGITAAELGADQVYVPEAVGGRLIRNLAHTRAFSPNGDGVNDAFELRFTQVQTSVPAVVTVHSLGGRELARLANRLPAGSQNRFTWDGRADGGVVPPGVYVVRVEVPADAGSETRLALTHIVY
ncbi:MAG: hypothetical protein O3A02_00290 [bacterium]|nr:hypothetical protein [bacterium]